MYRETRLGQETVNSTELLRTSALQQQQQQHQKKRSIMPVSDCRRDSELTAASVSTDFSRVRPQNLTQL